MDAIVDFLHRMRDLEGLVRWGGYVGLTIIIFAETGLLIGFFLPGDSLLVTAGLLSSPGGGGLLSVTALGVLLSVAAIAGNTCGYFIGRAAGPRLFTREDSLLFKRHHLQRAHEFYKRHGGKTMVLARFMPIVRTFVPVVAGAAEMDFRAFSIYNIGGGLLWIWSMLLLGYFLGNIPGVREHVELVILAVIFLSILPGIIAAARGWMASRKETTGR